MRAPDGSPIPTSQTAWTRPSKGPSIGWITCWPAMKAASRTSTPAPRSVATPTSELNRGQLAVDVHRQTAHSDDPDAQPETADRVERGPRACDPSLLRPRGAVAHRVGGRGHLNRAESQRPHPPG